MGMLYELYDTEWRSISVVQALSFREAQEAFEPFHKGIFWLENVRSGETQKVLLE
jgi:hypothetical protein